MIYLRNLILELTEEYYGNVLAEAQDFNDWMQELAKSGIRVTVRRPGCGGISAKCAKAEQDKAEKNKAEKNKAGIYNAEIHNIEEIRAEEIGAEEIGAEEIGAKEVSAEEICAEEPDPAELDRLLTLWLTDDAEIAAEHLQSMEPVLVLLHKGNQNQDFSEIKYACEDLTDLPAEYFDRVFCRQRQIPWDILTTERCLVRETVPEDVDDFYRIYREPSITKYMENLYPDRQQELAYIRDYIRNVYEFYGFGVWTVCLKEGEQVIGRAGLSYREGFEEPELGFVIGVPWQRQGIAREVCRAILRYGFEELELEAVIAFAEPGNTVSDRLLKSLGFQPAGEETLLGKRHILYRLKYRQDLLSCVIRQ